MKKCKKCGLIKDRDFFNKNHAKCKECYNEERREFYLLNKDKKKEYYSKYYSENKSIISEQKKEYRKNNVEKRKEWYLKNKEEISKKNKYYREKYSEEIKERKKNYYFLNKEKINEKIKLTNKKRRDYDVFFKLSSNIRTSIGNSIRRNSFSKNSKTEEILGCSFVEFKLYLESKFESWMSWENYGKYNGELNYGWDIDHIIPVSSAKTEEEILSLNCYLNLQPLCSKINRDIKINKINV